MRPTRFDYTYRPQKIPQPPALGYGSGYVLIAILSLISIVAAAAGVSSLTGLPFLICVFFAAIIYATKMYFIRPQIQYAEFISINWDKMVYYLITAFIFVMLAAFGLYSLNGKASAAALDQQPEKWQRSSPPQETSSSPVEPARNKEKANDHLSTDNVKWFIEETVAMNTFAMGCWFVPAMLELLIVLLVFHNRTRYEYWD